MVRRFAPLAWLPFFSGCIVVQQRHSFLHLGEFAGPLSDSDLVGRLLLMAAVFGLVGGVVAWISARCFTGLRARKRARMTSASSPC
jgi:hypothetical protein